MTLIVTFLTEMWIKSAPYFHQKSNKWTLVILIIFALMHTKLIPNGTTEENP